MLVKWDATARPCQALVARVLEPPRVHIAEPFDGTFLDMGEWLQAKVEASEATLFLHTSGVSDLLWALGWNLFQLQEPHPQTSYKHLMILPTSTQLFVDAIAIRNILAAHVTTWYIPVSSEPSNNTVRLSLKLWATAIWDGYLPMTTKTDVFAEAWHAASSFLGPLIPVQSILRGKRMSPEENFAGYISPEEANSTFNRFTLSVRYTGPGEEIRQTWLCGPIKP